MIYRWAPDAFAGIAQVLNGLPLLVSDPRRAIPRSRHQTRPDDPALGSKSSVDANFISHCAMGWPTAVYVPPEKMPKAPDGAPYDPFAIDGADHWYSVGAQRVRALENDLANRAFRPGYLRAV